MKKIHKLVVAIAFALACLLSWQFGWQCGVEPHIDIDGVEEGFIIKNVTFADAPTLDDLLDAIEQVESGGDPNAVGRDGEIGAYQLKKIYVDDVNRILKRWKQQMWEQINEPAYTYDDRLDRNLSRYMVEVYLAYYGPAEGDLESLARIHNGGPNGHQKESTKKYWLKVKARMGSK